MSQWWKDSASDANEGGAYGIAFTEAQLAANRKGELTPEQYPPFVLHLVAMLVVLALVPRVVRWTYAHRDDRAQLGAGALCALLICAFAAWPFGTHVYNALADRSGRACEVTGLSYGVHESSYGMGIMSFRVDNLTLRAHAGSKRAEALAPSGVPLRVFYACHSKTLASFEPAHIDWKATISPVQVALQEYFDFDAVDLATNRAGQVSLHQYPLVYPSFIAVTGALLLLLGQLAVKERGKWAKPLGLALLAAGGGLLYGHRHIFIDCVLRDVCHANGSPQALHVTVFKAHRTWHFEVDDIEFSFAEREGHHGLDPSHSYRFHYLCRSRQLLSTEVLATPESEGP